MGTQCAARVDPAPPRHVCEEPCNVQQPDAGDDAAMHVEAVESSSLLQSLQSMPAPTPTVPTPWHPEETVKESRFGGHAPMATHKYPSLDVHRQHAVPRPRESYSQAVFRPQRSLAGPPQRLQTSWDVQEPSKAAYGKGGSQLPQMLPQTGDAPGDFLQALRLVAAGYPQAISSTAPSSGAASTSWLPSYRQCGGSMRLSPLHPLQHGQGAPWENMGQAPAPKRPYVLPGTAFVRGPMAGLGAQGALHLANSRFTSSSPCLGSGARGSSTFLSPAPGTFGTPPVGLTGSAESQWQH